jgi:hypothetical protein
VTYTRRPPSSVVTAGTSLQDAEQIALASDQRLDTLDLEPLAVGMPTFPLADRLVSAKSMLTIEGASTLILGVEDPDWIIEGSGLLDEWSDGRLDAVDVALDNLIYRLAQASRQDQDVLQLTFEDLAVALLRTHRKHLAASRGSMTRAQFIELMVREIKSLWIPFFSPDKSIKQLVDQPDLPKITPPAKNGQGGFDAGTRITVKGVKADREQLRNIEICLKIADELQSTPRATLAMLVAGIGESEFRRSSTNPTTKAHGVFQLIPGTARSMGVDSEDTEQTARIFLAKGYYRYGGAMKIARENPGMSAGTIVSRVEGSDKGGDFYDPYHDEAKHILDAWNGGASSGTDEVLRTKQYQFTRGQPGKPESSWDAANRLASEVNWRFFVAGGVATFISDDRLMLTPAALRLDDLDAPGLLERPNYDWDHGKLAGEVRLRVSANAWSITPGNVVFFGDAFGPLGGRWIVHTVEQNLLDATDTTVTLIKPLPPRREPAAEVTTVTVDSSSGSKTKSRWHSPGGATVASMPLGRKPKLIQHSNQQNGTHDPNIPPNNWESDNALDLGVPVGTDVLAVDDGTIGSEFGPLQSNDPRMAGLRLHLETATNEWYYAHLSKFAAGLAPGVKVKAGQKLGESGAAGGPPPVPHLHLGCKTGKPEDLLNIT